MLPKRNMAPNRDPNAFGGAYKADRPVPKGADPHDPSERETAPALKPVSPAPKWYVEDPKSGAAGREAQIGKLQGGGEGTRWGVGRPETQGSQFESATVGDSAQIGGPGVTTLQSMAAGDVAAGVKRQEEKGLQNILAMKAGARQDAGLAHRSASTAAAGLGAETASAAGQLQFQAAQAEAGLEESGAGRQDSITQLQANLQQQTNMTNAQMEQQNAQFNAEIDAQLAMERDKRINELLQQGTSVEVATLQVEAEMEKARAQLEYQKWADLLNRRTQIDVSELENEAWYEDYNVETGESEPAAWLGDGDDSTPTETDPIEEAHGDPAADAAGMQPADPAAYNDGGIVPGRGNTDTQPAMLTPGELVIPKELTRQLLEVVARDTSEAQGHYQQGGRVSDTPWYPGKLPEYDETGLLIREQPSPARKPLGLAPRQPAGSTAGIAELVENPAFFKRTPKYGPTDLNDPDFHKGHAQRKQAAASGQFTTGNLPDPGDNDFFAALSHHAQYPNEPTTWLGKLGESLGQAYRDGPSMGVGRGLNSQEKYRRFQKAQERAGEPGFPEKTYGVSPTSGDTFDIYPKEGTEDSGMPPLPPLVPLTPPLASFDPGPEAKMSAAKTMDESDAVRKGIGYAQVAGKMSGGNKERKEAIKGLVKKEAQEKVTEEVGEKLGEKASEKFSTGAKAINILKQEGTEGKIYGARKLAADLGGKYIATATGIPVAAPAISAGLSFLDDKLLGTPKGKRSRVKVPGRGIGQAPVFANKGGVVGGIEALYDRLQYPSSQSTGGSLGSAANALYSLGARIGKGNK